MKSFTFKEELIFVDYRHGKLFNMKDTSCYQGEDKKNIMFDNIVKGNSVSLINDFSNKDNLLCMIINKKYQKEEGEGNFDKFKFDSFFKGIKTEGYYNLYLNYLRDHNIEEFVGFKKDKEKFDDWVEEEDNNIFFRVSINCSSKYFEEFIPWPEEQYVSIFDEDLSSKISSDPEKRQEWRIRRSNKDKEVNDNNIGEKECNKLINENGYVKKKYTFFEYIPESNNYRMEIGTNYLLVTPNWNSAASRITQITAIGDILYTVYHSYIYILSIILLLGMVGAIILTADNYQEIKVINIMKNKKSSFFSLYPLIILWERYIRFYKNIWNKINFIKCYIYINIFLRYYNNNNYLYNNYFIHVYKYVCLNYKNLRNPFASNGKLKKNIAIPSFFHTFSIDYIHSEDILGNLNYYIIANIIIAILLLSINSYFSLSVKYLEKGGGFECGFTSFVQTRERFNIIFYRVSLLFLVFDLEIILAFPYTAIYQKNQNISKNNVLAFLYILIIGFIYELKEGALNVVKKAHSIEININNK